MKRIVKFLLILSLLLLSLTGCQIRTRGYVAVTNYPVYYVASYIVGNKLTVKNISTDEYIGTCSLNADSQNILKEASVLCYISELEPYMNDIVTSLDDHQFDVIDLSQLSSVGNFKRVITKSVDDVTIVEEVPYYDSELFDSSLTYLRDPFLWLEPIALSSIALTIKDWLCANYPEDTLVYENNFNKLREQLVRLDLEYQSIKDKNVSFVSIAPTFGNWQKSYNVSVLPVVTNKDATLPNEEQLSFIKQQIKESKIKYIVDDPTLNEQYKELFNSLKDELKLTPISLSSLSCLSENDKEVNKDYLTIMYENLTKLEKVFK